MPIHWGHCAVRRLDAPVCLPDGTSSLRTTAATLSMLVSLTLTGGHRLSTRKPRAAVDTYHHGNLRQVLLEQAVELARAAALTGLTPVQIYICASAFVFYGVAGNLLSVRPRIRGPAADRRWEGDRPRLRGLHPVLRHAAVDWCAPDGLRD